MPGVALREFVDRMPLQLKLPLHERTFFVLLLLLLHCLVVVVVIVATFVFAVVAFSSLPELLSFVVLLTCNCCRHSQALPMLMRFAWWAWQR